MTSLRQIEANRRNAAQSTGPISKAGKQRSRQNAIRHGLCAETVIGVLEDIEDYQGFEAAIIADFNVETAVDRELVLRLASLLWRIRRATTIESTLFQIQFEILQQTRLDQSLRIFDDRSSDIHSSGNLDNENTGPAADRSTDRSTMLLLDRSKDLAYCFQRLVRLDGAAIEQLRRYEKSLARQITQTLSLLRRESRCRRASY